MSLIYIYIAAAAADALFPLDIALKTAFFADLKACLVLDADLPRLAAAARLAAFEAVFEAAAINFAALEAAKLAAADLDRPLPIDLALDLEPLWRLARLVPRR